jgi:hypothetical protein
LVVLLVAGGVAVAVTRTNDNDNQAAPGETTTASDCDRAPDRALCLQAGSATTDYAPATTEFTQPPTTTTPPPTEYAVGAKVSYTDGATVQLYSYQQGVPSQNQFSQPAAGLELAVLDVQVCAGPSAKMSYNELGFSALAPDNRNYNNSFSAAREPRLLAGDLPAGGGCRRGWVTLEVPKGQRPVYIIWDYAGYQQTRWRL